MTRSYGDIQTAVVRLVDRLVPRVPVSEQPAHAREIARTLTSGPTSMNANMLLRQGVIRGSIATTAHVIEGLAAWVTVLFDIGNLRHDRARALALPGQIVDGSFERLSQALAKSREGCILVLPHVGSNELFLAHLVDEGFRPAFVYSIGAEPTPTERWLLEGRLATGGVPIPFGRRHTRSDIAEVLKEGGVVCMLVDVYPGERLAGTPVRVHGVELAYAPGAAGYARMGVPVLPAFATRREANSFSMEILDPLEYRATRSESDANAEYMQRLSASIGGFTEKHPEAFWLWHPIPNDPYRFAAERHRPDLLRKAAPTPEDDEAMARAVEALAGVV